MSRKNLQSIGISALILGVLGLISAGWYLNFCPALINPTVPTGYSYHPLCDSSNLKNAMHIIGLLTFPLLGIAAALYIAGLVKR
jgi:hypothetical protein